MVDLDRWQPYSLAAAALTLLLALVALRELFVGLLFCEVGCLTFIWCGEMIGTFIGAGVTQETPGCFVAGIGWGAQILLLLGVVALAALRLVHP